VPLRHDPGHAQVDFGEALAVIAGEERKIHFFAMDLPHSDGCVVQAYPAESTEAFCEGHRVSFEFFGGVPRSILYDYVARHIIVVGLNRYAVAIRTTFSSYVGIYLGFTLRLFPK